MEQWIVPWMRRFLPPEQRRHLKLVSSGPDTRSALGLTNYVQALLRHWDTYILTLTNPFCTEELSPFFMLSTSLHSFYFGTCMQTAAQVLLMAETEYWVRKLQQHPWVKFGQTCVAATVIKGHFAVCSSTRGWIVLWSKAGASEPSPQGLQSSLVFCPPGPSRPRFWYPWSKGE